MKRTVLALAMAACAAQPGDAPTEAIPRLTANALSAAAVAHATLTTDVLDGASAAAMAGSADAREVLAYAVGCALDASQTISFTVGGTPYTFAGAMGIAPGWTTTGLAASEAAWVSACVFSRVNLTGTSIAISARGATSGLATTSGELAAYQVEEARSGATRSPTSARSRRTRATASIRPPMTPRAICRIASARSPTASPART